MFSSLLDDNHMKLLMSIILWVQSLMSQTVAKPKADNEDNFGIFLSLTSCDAIVVRRLQSLAVDGIAVLYESLNAGRGLLPVLLPLYLEMYESVH